MDSSSTSRTITVRNAILYGALLVLSQMLITQWTIQVAGQQDIIDYVSFAGTVTSMLLAVLAIVYSYYTTTAQKGDADKIAAQIASLTHTVTTLDRSEIRLSNELMKLGEIRVQLDDVGDRVRSNNELSAATRESVELMRADLTARLSAAEVTAQARPDEQESGDEWHLIQRGFAKALPGNATDKQCILFFAAYQKMKGELPIMDAVKTFVMPFLKNAGSFHEAATFGEVFAYVMILLNMDVIGSGERNDPIFLQSLKTRVETSFSDEDDDSVAWSKVRPFLVSELSKLTGT